MNNPDLPELPPASLEPTAVPSPDSRPLAVPSFPPAPAQNEDDSRSGAPLPGLSANKSAGAETSATTGVPGAAGARPALREVAWLCGILLGYLFLSSEAGRSLFYGWTRSPDLLASVVGVWLLLVLSLQFRRRFFSGFSLMYDPAHRRRAGILAVFCLCAFLAAGAYAKFGDGWLRAETGIGLPQALVLILLVPLAEELYFRGVLLFHLRQWFGPVAAVAGSSLLFGVLHCSSGGALQLCLLGLAASLAALRFRSVAPAVQLHATWNACVVLIANPLLFDFIAAVAAMLLVLPVIVLGWRERKGRHV